MASDAKVTKAKRKRRDDKLGRKRSKDLLKTKKKASLQENLVIL